MAAELHEPSVGASFAHDLPPAVHEDRVVGEGLPRVLRVVWTAIGRNVVAGGDGERAAALHDHEGVLVGVAVADGAVG